MCKFFCRVGLEVSVPCAVLDCKMSLLGAFNYQGRRGGGGGVEGDSGACWKGSRKLDSISARPLNLSLSLSLSFLALDCLQFQDVLPSVEKWILRVSHLHVWRELRFVLTCNRRARVQWPNNLLLLLLLAMSADFVKVPFTARWVCMSISKLRYTLNTFCEWCDYFPQILSNQIPWCHIVTIMTRQLQKMLSTLSSIQRNKCSCHQNVCLMPVLTLSPL
jgi:hypothetical protein